MNSTRIQVKFAITFLIVLLTFEYVYALGEGSPTLQFFVHDLIIKPSVWIIDLMSPSLNVRANENKIVSDQGGIILSRGCDGVETMLIIISALIAAPIAFARRIAGILIGTLIIYGFNQARILAMFYLIISSRSAFNFIHGYIGPVTVIIIGALFFWYWIAPRNATPTC